MLKMIWICTKPSCQTNTNLPINKPTRQQNMKKNQQKNRDSQTTSNHQRTTNEHSDKHDERHYYSVDAPALPSRTYQKGASMWRALTVLLMHSSLWREEIPHTVWLHSSLFITEGCLLYHIRRLGKSIAMATLEICAAYVRQNNMCESYGAIRLLAFSLDAFIGFSSRWQIPKTAWRCVQHLSVFCWLCFSSIIGNQILLLLLFGAWLSRRGEVECGRSQRSLVRRYSRGT